MLKKLFYASASILMLAIVYHLRANSARAQAGATISSPSFNGGWGCGVVGRTVYNAPVL